MYTDAAWGISTRLGLKEKWYRGMGGRRLQIYGKLNGVMRAVAYNATMQGGIINRTSPYIIRSSEIRRIITSSEISMLSSYKKIQIEYSHTYISREFKKGSAHAWGKLSFILGF